MQASHVVEAAKKAPVKSAKKAATKVVKKTASKAKSAVSGASFWYGADRPGYLGEYSTLALPSPQISWSGS